MDFNEALANALKKDRHTHKDPFLLSNRISDLVGNDYEAKRAAEAYFRLDSRYHITETAMKCAPAPGRRKKTKHYYRIKSLPPPPDNAFVFMDMSETQVVHMSRECPCLKGKKVIRSLYRYQSLYSGSTQICRICGHFAPTYPSKLFELLRLFISEKFGIWEFFYDIV